MPVPALGSEGCVALWPLFALFMLSANSSAARRYATMNGRVHPCEVVYSGVQAPSLPIYWRCRDETKPRIPQPVALGSSPRCRRRVGGDPIGPDRRTLRVLKSRTKDVSWLNVTYHGRLGLSFPAEARVLFSRADTPTACRRRADARLLPAMKRRLSWFARRPSRQDRAAHDMSGRDHGHVRTHANICHSAHRSFPGPPLITQNLPFQH